MRAAGGLLARLRPVRCPVADAPEGGAWAALGAAVTAAVTWAVRVLPRVRVSLDKAQPPTPNSDKTDEILKEIRALSERVARIEGQLDALRRQEHS